MERFTYQHVAVSGAKDVSATLVQAFVQERLAASSKGFISGRNIFVYNFEPLKQEIEDNFPAVRSATVARDTTLGNGLTITLEERSPYAFWCESNLEDCFILDESGVVFAPASRVATSSLPTPYVFRGALSTTTLSVISPPLGEVYSPGHFLGITALMRDLTEAGAHPVGAKLEADTDFSIFLSEGYYIKASYGEDSLQLTRNLALVLESEALAGKLDQLEYVDLRFGNRVYYKFKGKPASHGSDRQEVSSD